MSTLSFLAWAYFLLVPVIAVICCVWEDRDELRERMSFSLNPFSSWPRKNKRR